MIPKKIHYCWFGGREKPKEVINMIQSWREKLPDYEIIEWNESNFDFPNQYTQEAYEQNKWAFITDYVRLLALKNNGGIYLDTDVEVIKSFDDLLNQESFVCKETDELICTAVIGSKQNAEWVTKLLDKYDQRKFVLDNGDLDMLPNSDYINQYLVNELNYSSKDTTVCLSGLTIYTEDYFSPINLVTHEKKITSNTYAIHHFSGSWLTSRMKLGMNIKKFLRKAIGENKWKQLKQLMKGKNK